VFRRLASDVVCLAARVVALWHRRSALKLHRYAVGLDDGNQAARYELASMLWACGLEDESIREYRRLARRYPLRATFHYELGFVLRTVGRHQEAINALECALSLEPRAEIHVELARCYRALGRTHDAVSALNRALRHSPDHPDALREHLHLANESRHWFRVVDEGGRLMSSVPDAEVARVTGIGLHQSGQLAEAENVLRQGLALDPSSIDLQVELAIVLSKRGQAVAAERILRGCVDANGDDWYLYSALSHVLSTAGRSDDALVAAERAVALKPDSAEAVATLGLAQHALEQRAEAMRSFERALEIEPNFRLVRASLAVLLGELGRHDEAVVSFERILGAEPDFFESPEGAQYSPFYEASRQRD
jgi:tetratricopeptide (TPR) repeat protein